MANIYVLKDEDLDVIKQMLYSVTSYGQEYPKESIMKFEKVCIHDDAFMCECRLNKLIEFIQTKNVSK